LNSGWQVLKEAALRAGWAPLAVLVAHPFLGGLLGHEPYVDPVIHFAGGVAAAYFIRYVCSIEDRLLGAPSDLAKDLLAFGLTVVAALVWEVGEFCSDVFLDTNIQRDVGNTMRDLILGAMGGGSFVLIARIVRHRSKRRVM
jgi:hypothetical protein